MNSSLRSAALAVIAVIAAGHFAQAAIVVGLVLDPATTAGSSADVNSIYSGLGTWHLFAVDDNDDDFGISSYNIDLTGATAIRHTSPFAFGIEDASGDVYEAGFNTLRGAYGSVGSSSIQASQPLPDRSPFLITGLGQQTGNFAAVTGGALSSGSTSPSWGDYNTISPLNGKNWLFLAEGKYDQGVLPSIAQAIFTVYNNRATFSSKLSSTAIVPEPITPTLLTPEYLAHLTETPSPAPVEVPPVVEPAPQPIVVPPQPIDDLSTPPIANEDPHETALPVKQPDPNIGDGGWIMIRGPSIETGTIDGFVYYIEPSLIDFVQPVTAFPYGEFVHHGGLQYAMMTALTGSKASETTIDDGLFHADFAPTLMSFRFNATSQGLFDQLSMDSAVAAPEPGSLVFATFGAFSLLATRWRRR